MSDTVTHIIKTQVIEAKVPRSPSPFETQERIRQLFYKEILPRLEKILDEMDPGAETIHIEHLEIDTGQIPVQLLEQELPRRMEEKFRAQLREKIEADPQSQQGLSRQDPETRKRHWLRAFLETGNLPWWAQPMARSAFLATFAETVPVSAGLIASVLSGPRAGEAAQRIWWNLPPETAQALVSSLHNEAGASAELLAAGLQLRMRGGRLPSWKSLEAFSAQVWAEVLSEEAKEAGIGPRLGRNAVLTPEKWPESFGEALSKAAGKPELAPLYRESGKLMPALATLFSALPAAWRSGAEQTGKADFEDELRAFRGALLLSALSGKRSGTALREAWSRTWALQFPEFSGLQPLSWAYTLAAFLAGGKIGGASVITPAISPATGRQLREWLFILLDAHAPLRQEIAGALPSDDSGEKLRTELLKRYPALSGAIESRENPYNRENSDAIDDNQDTDREESTDDFADADAQETELEARKEREAIERVEEEDGAESRFGKEQPSEKQRDESSSGSEDGLDDEEELGLEEAESPINKERKSGPDLESETENLKPDPKDKASEGPDGNPANRKKAAPGSEPKPLKPHPRVQRPSKRSKGPSWGTPPWRRKAEPEFFISNAGLVLVWPFFQSYFDKTGLMEGGAFRDEVAAMRGAGLLQYLASGRPEADPEFEYALNKILCGLDPEQPVPPIENFAENEIEEAQNLLNAVIEYWPALGKASPDSIRGMYLMRAGQIARKDSDFLVIIERNAFDILLDKVPWGFKTLKLPWNRYFIHVEW